MQRVSKQSEIIRENLMSRMDHPTAEMVYSAVRETYPNISLATVYRNLRLLSEENEAICFSLDGKDRFDCNTRPHLHLCCTRCGSIKDQDTDYDQVEQLAPDMKQISNVIIHGICDACSS